MGLKNSDFNKVFPVLRGGILVLNYTLSFSLIKQLHCLGVCILFSSCL